MLTRPAMIALILAERSTAFQGEIAHHVHGVDDREYEYDEVSALLDIEDRNDCSDGDKSLLRTARRLLIAIGFYRPMTADEIANTYSTSGTAWAFKLAGIAYTSDYNNDDWFDPSSQMGD
jgi:hypothetical protein